MRIERARPIAGPIVVWAAALFVFAVPSFARDAVFILGEDKPGTLAFFTPAEAYYRAQNVGSDRLLVTGARSLQDVREVLQTSGQGHWDSVTLVMHGSPWEGAHIDVYSDGEPAHVDAMRRAADSGGFPPVSDDRIDASTELRLDSCGLGLRADYLDALARLLGGDDRQRPRVIASRHYVAFARTYRGDDTAEYRRLELPLTVRALPVPLSRLSPAKLRREVAALRRTFSASWADAATAPRWKPSPVYVRAAIPIAGIDGRTPLQVAVVDGKVRETLRAYGLDRRSLQWRWDPSDEAAGIRTLVGEGTVILMHADPAWALTAAGEQE